MNYIEIAGLYLNLDHVSYIREEEHSQFGTVLAIHFSAPGAMPLFIGAHHYDELRTYLLDETPAPEAAG